MMQSSNRQKKQQAKSLFNKNDFYNASKILTELCKESPDAECHYLLAVIYGHSSKFEHSEQHAKFALQLDPNYEQAWNQLGITQAAQGNIQLATSSFQRSLEVNPKNTLALNNLGNLYRELGDYNNAENCYKQSLRLDSKNFIAINNIANIYLTRCQYTKAENYYKKAIKLKKDYFDAYYNLGATYQSMGDHKSAIKLYKRAQKLKPDDIQPQAAIANSYEKQGNYEKSLEYLTPLLARNIVTPDIADIYSKICLKNKNYDEGINVINKCLAMNLNPIHEQAVRFSLGDIFDKQGSYDQAFEQYSTANTMRPYQYDKASSESAFNYIKQVFSEADIQLNYTSENLSNTPIFIIGMPRSGTSLIEQILSSHSEVCGAGELPYIGEIAEQTIIENKSLRYPDCIKHLTNDKLSELSNTYLSKLKQHGDNSHYIIDKMPHNFLYVGLIHRLFPNCKIIHCLRNPLDVCLSVYFHNFNQNHPYSDSLENLGHYYNQYRKLMSYWHKQYDNLLIDISYEDLLSDAEINIRNILQHVGLEWEDSCLKYYENKRIVSTPSYSQVTQPLYTSSMERWRNYSTHIDDLKAAINEKYLHSIA